MSKNIPNIDPNSSIFDTGVALLTEKEQTLIDNFFNRNSQLKTPEHKFCGEQDLDYYFNGTGVNSSWNQSGDWIQTFSGRRFYPMDPDSNAIVLQDIAHALSMQCRFTGHCNEFYSVAQHCVGVSFLCDAKDALAGLLHDASEAYLIDVPRPLKHSGKFDFYKEVEIKVTAAIAKKFNLSELEPESVKIADKIILATEARDLMSPLRSDWDWPFEPVPFIIKPLPPKEARKLFMNRFFQLKGSSKAEIEKYSFESTFIKAKLYK